MPNLTDTQIETLAKWLGWKRYNNLRLGWRMPTGAITNTDAKEFFMVRGAEYALIEKLKTTNYAWRAEATPDDLVCVYIPGCPPVEPDDECQTFAHALSLAAVRAIEAGFLTEDGNEP